MPILAESLILDQTLFPQLPPELPANGFNLKDTGLDNSEYDALLSAMLTLCVQAGRWEPALGAKLSIEFSRIGGHDITKAIHDLGNADLIIMHTVQTEEDKRWLVEPTPAFIDFYHRLIRELHEARE